MDHHWAWSFVAHQQGAYYDTASSDVFRMKIGDCGDQRQTYEADNCFHRSNLSHAILRIKHNGCKQALSLIDEGRKASGNFHSAERFKGYFLRAGHGELIIERCFVLAVCVMGAKAPRLHILQGSSFQ
jgi:hypothetical protein